MERKVVKSRTVKSVGYDPKTKTLEVEYKSGGIYHYADVPPEKHKALMSAKSIGTHLHTHIKSKHEHKKLENTDGDK
jgi:hypothetical protein